MCFECRTETVYFSKGQDDIFVTSPFWRNKFAWFELYKSGSGPCENMGPKVREVENHWYKPYTSGNKMNIGNNFNFKFGLGKQKV